MLDVVDDVAIVDLDRDDVLVVDGQFAFLFDVLDSILVMTRL